MERDEESGLSYHAARYYASAFCRWISPDPLYNGTRSNPYAYASGRPMELTDRNGLQEKKPDQQGPPSSTPVVSQVPNRNTVVRKTNPSVNKSPESSGMKAKDPNANVSAGEHALNEHQGGPTPWLSGSDTLLGDPKIEGTRYWISKSIAKKTGTKVISTDQLLTDVDRIASERNSPGFSERIANYFKPDQANIKEVLFRGYISPGAIESLATRACKGAGWR